MTFVAEASTTIPVPVERAFDQLAAHDTWPAWMPPSFVAVGPSRGALRAGDTVRVRIAGTPGVTPLEVRTVDRPRELTWCGGVRGVLYAEHRFLFEPEGQERTRVRSVETWRGVLAPLVRALVKPRAERVGREQLAALARVCERGAT